jgi:hypothetical protein
VGKTYVKHIDLTDALITKAIRDHKEHLISCSCKAVALLEMDPQLVPVMSGADMRNPDQSGSLISIL